ncbi:hypothetical protein U1Q18_013238, partial [Sarracenia purpurea var. burkii]
KLWFVQAFSKFLADVLLFALVSEAGCGPGFKCQCFAVSCSLVGFGFTGFSADFVAWVQDGAVPLLRFMVIWCLVL